MRIGGLPTKQIETDAPLMSVPFIGTPFRPADIDVIFILNDNLVERLAVPMI